MINKMTGLKVLVFPLSLGVVVALAIFYIQPKYLELRNYKKSVEEGKAQLANLQDQSQKLTQLKSSWQSMEERKIIEVALPTNDEAIDDFLLEMYRKATHSGVVIDNVNSSQVNSSGDLSSYSCLAAGEMMSPTGIGREFPSGNNPQALDTATVSNSSENCAKSLRVEVEVKGTWEQLLNFFRNIAESNRIANFKKASVTSVVQSGESKETSDFLSGKVTLEVYYKPKSKGEDLAALSSLASRGGFSKSVISKIKEMVYSPYETPAVYETGERNVFK